MKKILIFLFIFPLYHYSQEPLQRGLAIIDKEKAQEYIGVLASDSLMGREAGMDGGRMAAEYIKSVFEKIGIKPWQGNYFQIFDVSSGEESWNVVRRERYKGLTMRNVLGYIPGRNSDEIVIIGAHYDHLGIKSNSTNDSIYNGADDNASGVSAVLQVAEAFITSGKQPERTIIFALWDAEEIGLIGSFHFVSEHFENVPIPRLIPQTIKGYINCDMIGRSKDDTYYNHVITYFSQDRPLLGEWIKEDVKEYNLVLEPDFRSSDDLQGGSDHMAFSMRGIPYIFYFTDLHADYHQPTDHADQIDYNKITEITKLAYLNMWRMANDKEF